jgi:hypothetical protein
LSGIPSPLSFEEARDNLDGYVVVDGEFGGICYLVCPINLVRCSEESLRALAHDLEDAIFSGDTSGVGVHYKRLALDEELSDYAVGEAPGIALRTLWLPKWLSDPGLGERIQHVLAGQLQRLELSPDERTEVKVLHAEYHAQKFEEDTRQRNDGEDVNDVKELNEVYLGGFYSPMQLSLGKFAVGAGIYATNRRLFIFRKDMDVSFSKIAGNKDFVPANLTPEQNFAIVNELSSEPSSQMVLRKEEISTLELKEPPGAFRTGYLNILRISGESQKIGIGKKKEYEYILNLLQSFSPQAIRKL